MPEGETAHASSSVHKLFTYQGCEVVFNDPGGDAVKKRVKQGFLNRDLKLPLGTLWRTQIEADLLVQNLMLTADSMGLGAWIHASIGPPVLLGDPKFTDRHGSMLGFDGITPRWKPIDLYVAEASKYSEDVIECTRGICNYVYDTHGRFPAHVEEGYYEQFFRDGLTDVHHSRGTAWHGTR